MGASNAGRLFMLVIRLLDDMYSDVRYYPSGPSLPEKRMPSKQLPCVRPCHLEKVVTDALHCVGL